MADTILNLAFILSLRSPSLPLVKGHRAVAKSMKRAWSELWPHILSYTESNEGKVSAEGTQAGSWSVTLS